VVTCYLPRAPQLAEIEALCRGLCASGAAEAVLLSREALPPAVRGAAEALGVQAYCRENYINRLADFKPYLAKLRAEYEKGEIESYFVPLKIQEEMPGAKLGEPVPLDAFLDAWLAAPERNHLSLLGDFGTGKTWFVRRLAWRYSNGGRRVPLLIALRDYSRAYDIEQALTDACVNRFGIQLAAGFKTLQRLTDEGRLLLIFDGFDEMERRASDYRTALENFWQIARLVSPRAKILLACRTSFFRHRTEEQEVLEQGREPVRVKAGDDVIDLAGHKGFEVVHLTGFDDAQIRLALQKRIPAWWEPLFERIRALPRIEDLAHRPVLLDMIARTLPEIASPEDLNLATLYEGYTDNLLRKRGESESIPAADRLFFVQELAQLFRRSEVLNDRAAAFADVGLQSRQSLAPCGVIFRKARARGGIGRIAGVEVGMAGHLRIPQHTMEDLHGRHRFFAALAQPRLRGEQFFRDLLRHSPIALAQQADEVWPGLRMARVEQAEPSEMIWRGGAKRRMWWAVALVRGVPGRDRAVHFSRQQ
jgi:hypothetical protein